MPPLVLLLATTSLGVDYGWQPTGDGQLEYIIQIEPSLLDALKSGVPITSEIPPEVRGVRRFRIRVGQGDVPRNRDPVVPAPRAGDPPAPESRPSSRPSSGTPTPAATPDPSLSDPPRAETPDPLPREAPPRKTLESPAEDEDTEPPTGDVALPADSVDRPQTPNDIAAPKADDDRFLTPPRPLPREQQNDAPLFSLRPGSTSQARPLKKASFAAPSTEKGEDAATLKLEKPTLPPTTAKTPARPWGWLTLAVFGLFASLGCNVYLGWIAWDYHRRYRATLGVGS